MKIEDLKNKIIAHRGIYDNTRIYENTVGAIERCIKLNIPVFLDVSLLKDNNLICFADKTLTRLIHVEEELKDSTLNDINYYSKIKISTLEEALVLIRGKIPVILNIKSTSKKHFIENKILSMLKNYPDNVFVQSNDLSVLKYIHKNNKNIKIGYSVDKKNYYKFFIFHAFDYVAIDSLLVSDRQARKLRESYFLIGYGIKDRNQYLKKKGCYDAYICDNILDIIQI
ncbi:MAG: glycerophosphodiester phosphodiesterase [Bacilli bacterium]|nr:glycerophosphodiester phosphodiesterase [Bacilli bacterium]